MDRIDQAIRESLLESYLYRESTGQAALIELPARQKMYLRYTIYKAVRKGIDDGVLFCRVYCTDPVNQITIGHTFRNFDLEDRMMSILLNELQKMRTE